jgi:hypothetical protein
VSVSAHHWWKVHRWWEIWWRDALVRATRAVCGVVLRWRSRSPGSLRRVGEVEEAVPHVGELLGGQVLTACAATVGAARTPGRPCGPGAPAAWRSPGAVLS